MPETRLTFDQALRLYREADPHELGRMAHALRLRKTPPDMVTYVVDRNINYTDVCVCGCRFCAFHKTPGSGQGSVLGFEELGRKIEETLTLGGRQILLQGGCHPDLRLVFYEDMLRFITERYPEVHAHAFSPPEIAHIAAIEGLSFAQVIARLKAAGLRSIPGGGAEILVDRVRRKVSPAKCSAGDWLEVMRQAHMQGLRTTATMMFGHEESVEERLEHLLALRDLQDETGGFTAFIPWAFQPGNTAMQRAIEPPAVYLRVLAVSRLVLDNFDNIQASWVTMGAKVAQLALFWGANDFGSTMIEENVVAAAGVRFRMDEDELRAIVTVAGFTPRRRRMDYSLLEA
jgi:cyclic dehypoxanthinyl futalosine synthase